MKADRRAVHGVLLIDKVVGPSSHAVLGQARRLWNVRKGGHTGTLDPLASGLMPLCFGAATKFAQMGLDADKAYRATIRLGQTRVGGDGEGAIVLERAVHCDRATIDIALSRFVGTIEQTPPMQSALKHQGKPLYELARAGVEVVRQPRRVTIHRITVVSWSTPTLVIDVACSKGTYMRMLAQDLGEALGCGAHLAGLRRTRTGGFDVANAITLEDADKLDAHARDERLLPIDSLLSTWPCIQLDADNAGRFLTGLRRRVVHADTPNLRVYGPDEALPPGHRRPFLGSGHVQGGELIADRLLSPVEVEEAVHGPAKSGVQLIETEEICNV